VQAAELRQKRLRLPVQAAELRQNLSRFPVHAALMKQAVLATSHSRAASCQTQDFPPVEALPSSQSLAVSAVAV